MIICGGWEGRGEASHKNKQITVSGMEWGEGRRERGLTNGL